MSAAFAELANSGLGVGLELELVWGLPCLEITLSRPQPPIDSKPESEAPRVRLGTGWVERPGERASPRPHLQTHARRSQPPSVVPTPTTRVADIMLSANAWQPTGTLKSAPAPLVAPPKPQIFASHLPNGPPLPPGRPPLSQREAVKTMNEGYGEMQCWITEMLDSGMADDAFTIDAMLDA